LSSDLDACKRALWQKQTVNDGDSDLVDEARLNERIDELTRLFDADVARLTLAIDRAEEQSAIIGFFSPEFW
jgi:hypothetical protein